MVKKVLANCYIYLILFLMYLPILVIIAFSFTNATSIGQWAGFSFELYAELFSASSKDIWLAVANTLIIAFISSIISVVLGTMGALGTFYSKKRIRDGVEVVTQIPVVNPEIVIALSLTVLFVFVGSYIFKSSIFSFWTLLIGHVILSLPFVYLSVKPKLQQMDPHLYEAALDLGAAPSVALRKVTIPQIMPGIFSGFLLAITLSLDDFIVTAFTRGSGLLNGTGTIETLSTLIQAKIKKGPIPPEMRALTTIIFLVVLLLVIGLSVYNNVYKPRLARKEKTQNV